MKYRETLQPGDNTPVVKITRYPSGWFVTTEKQLHGPFRAKYNATLAVAIRDQHNPPPQ